MGFRDSEDIRKEEYIRKEENIDLTDIEKSHVDTPAIERKLEAVIKSGSPSSSKTTHAITLKILQIQKEQMI